MNKIDQNMAGVNNLKAFNVTLIQHTVANAYVRTKKRRECSK